MTPRRRVGDWSRRGALAGAAAAGAWPMTTLGQEPPGAVPEAQIQGRRDPSARLTTAVFVEGQGPYRFVIDTGATRSVVSDRLALALKLRPAEPTLVHGLMAAQPAPAVRVEHMMVGRLPVPTRTVPVLRADDLDCDGLLGLDAFRDRRVVFDFARGSVSVLKPAYPGGSSRGARPLSEAVVRARRKFGQLTIVDAGAAGHGVSCFIDSGAQVSVGNLALLQLIKARAARKGLQNQSAVIHGATGDEVICEVALVEGLRIGEIYFPTFAMAFADLHTFELWSLKQEPAIMIGVDFLNSFGRVEIDFSEDVVRFQRAPSRR